jgi:hypothetical protein
MATTETVTEDREETQDERFERLRIEHAALRSREYNSLRGRLERILAAGGYVSGQSDRDGASYEHALLEYAAVVTKAVGIAVLGDEYISSNHPIEVDFTPEEASRALVGLSALLTEASHLIRSLSIADEVQS